MMFSNLLVTGPSLVSLIAAQEIDFNKFQPSTELEWHPCNGTKYCAVLAVPLDRANLSLGQAFIPLIRIPAEANSKNGSYKGMVITNPGGPGDSGIFDLVGVNGFGASVYQPTIGANYDIVSFDPRGIQNAVPNATCVSLSNSRLRRKKLNIPALPTSDFQQAIIAAAEVGKECASSIGMPTGAGSHMTTADTARDLISIVDAFARSEAGKSVSNSSLLNYWGFSYGTFIGQTFASMFPNRVGRVVLDGITDPEQYVTVGFGSRGLTSTDDAFSTLFIYCSFAGIENCSFWKSTPLAVYDRFEQVVSQLNVETAETNRWDNSTSIDSALQLLKQVLFLATYAPIIYFPVLSDALVGLEGALQVEALDEWAIRLEQNLPDTPAEWGVGVYCSDANGFSYDMNYTEIRHWIDSLENESVIGGSSYGLDRIQCTGWSIRGDEVYSGPFNSEPQNPILFVSNTLDPATPLPNGLKSSANYKDSHLLTIDGVGHRSLGSMNTCAFSKIGAFFQTGILPNGPESFCHLEAGPWGVQLPGKLSDYKDLEIIKDRMKKAMKPVRHRK